MNYARLVQLWNQDGLRLTRDDGGTFKVRCKLQSAGLKSGHLADGKRKLNIGFPTVALQGAWTRYSLSKFDFEVAQRGTQARSGCNIIGELDDSEA